MAPKLGTPEGNARFDAIVAKTLVNEGSVLYDATPKNCPRCHGAEIAKSPDGHWHCQRAGCGADGEAEYSKYGISLRFLRSVSKNATRHDIDTMTLDGAKYLYGEYFWDAPGVWQIEGDALAYKVFDLGVNNGTGTAIRMLQRAINACGAPITVDGQVGPKTAASANNINPVNLLVELKIQARARYELLAEKVPNHAADLKGWLARLDKA